MNELNYLKLHLKFLRQTLKSHNLDLPIKDLKNWDSIKNLMLLNSIEESYNFQFSDNQLESIMSLRDVFTR